MAGLIASAFAWAIGLALRLKRNRDDFGSLAGKYSVNEKEPSQRPDGTVVIDGNGPNLNFVWTFADGTEARGQIAMNEQSRVTGSGSYEHVRDERHGWGDVWLQVGSRERDAVRLLVDGRYTNQEKRLGVASAWVWEMETSRERQTGG